MVRRIARSVGALALAGALGCADHHGRATGAQAGGGAAAADSSAPEGGRKPAAAAGSGGTAASGMEAAGGASACDSPSGECLSALALARSSGPIYTGDIDGDRDLDVVAPFSVEAGWLENAAAPTWHPIATAQDGRLQYADVTGDGIADEVRFNREPCGGCEDRLALHIGEGDGTGRFANPERIEACEVGFSPWRFWLADLDGDGDSEYLLDSRCGQQLQQLRVFDSPFSDWKELHVSVEALATADLDGDSHIDIVAVEHPDPVQPRLIVLRGEGGLGFAAVPVALELPLGHGREVQILDLYGDGGRDIAVLGGDASEHSWIATFRWMGGQLERVTIVGIPGFVSDIALANTDADCGDELIAARAQGESAGAALFAVDPEMGLTKEVRFASDAPEVTFLASLSLLDRRNRRLFGQTTMGQLVELKWSRCDPAE